MTVEPPCCFRSLGEKPGTSGDDIVGLVMRLLNDQLIQIGHAVLVVSADDGIELVRRENGELVSRWGLQTDATFNVNVTFQNCMTQLTGTA